MAREFAKAFYDSKAWKECRQSYINNMPIYKRGLCEECYDKGKYTLGKELHHKVLLTPKNIHNPEVALNHKNLILLCFDCHQRIHGKRQEPNEYIFDENGNLLPRMKSNE